MILATCIGVLRDENRHIIGYRLADRHNHVVVIKPIILKDKIANKEIDVSNLTLTSDNRLVVSTKDNTDNYISFLKDLKSVHRQAITNIGSGELTFHKTENTYGNLVLAKIDNLYTDIFGNNHGLSTTLVTDNEGAKFIIRFKGSNGYADMRLLDDVKLATPLSNKSNVNDNIARIKKLLFGFTAQIYRWGSAKA
jgi:hypothetical protein